MSEWIHLLQICVEKPGLTSDNHPGKWEPCCAPEKLSEGALGLTALSAQPEEMSEALQTCPERSVPVQAQQEPLSVFFINVPNVPSWGFGALRSIKIGIKHRLSPGLASLGGSILGPSFKRTRLYFSTSQGSFQGHLPWFVAQNRSEPEPALSPGSLHSPELSLIKPDLGTSYLQLQPSHLAKLCIL